MLGRVTTRRDEFRRLIPDIISRLDTGRGVPLASIYAAINRDHPHLVDDEPDPHAPERPLWEHDVRWEIETLVLHHDIRRRKDLGRGMYSR
jgi:hypothetical protein